MSQPLTIALTKGRILEETLPLLAAAGIEPLEDMEKSRKLVFDTTQAGVRLLLLRGADVPTYVQYGAADLGVAGKDVLLVVFAPWCTHCKKLLPTYEILARAVQGEPRIVVAKINGETNDIPAAWGVKAYPTLLWFRASDKDQLKDDLSALAPRDYWDAGYSLHELASFVQRQGSFDLKSMRVASNEQLATLQADEDVLRVQYEIEERHQMRNTGRVVYETRAAHDGRWNSSPALWTAMLDAALQGFPVPPSGVRRVNVEVPR